MSTMPEITIDVALGDDTLTDCLHKPDLLTKQLTVSNKKAINDFIFDQLTDKDGAPEITNFDVKTIGYNMETQTGTFRLSFQINRRFCCSDVEACANDYLDFAFDYEQNVVYAKATYFQWEMDN